MHVRRVTLKEQIYSVTLVGHCLVKRSWERFHSRYRILSWYSKFICRKKKLNDTWTQSLFLCRCQLGWRSPFSLPCPSSAPKKEEKGEKMPECLIFLIAIRMNVVFHLCFLGHCVISDFCQRATCLNLYFHLFHFVSFWHGEIINCHY